MPTLADILSISEAQNDVPPVDNINNAPLIDTTFTGLPPTVAVSAECDPLADDARDYVDAIRRARGQAVWLNDIGLVHGHLRARHSVTRAPKL